MGLINETEQKNNPKTPIVEAQLKNAPNVSISQPPVSIPQPSFEQRLLNNPIGQSAEDLVNPAIPTAGESAINQLGGISSQPVNQFPDVYPTLYQTQQQDRSNQQLFDAFSTRAKRTGQEIIRAANQANFDSADLGKWSTEQLDLLNNRLDKLATTTNPLLDERQTSIWDRYWGDFGRAYNLGSTVNIEPGRTAPWNPVASSMHELELLQKGKWQEAFVEHYIKPFQEGNVALGLQRLALPLLSRTNEDQYGEYGTGNFGMVMYLMNSAMSLPIGAATDVYNLVTGNKDPRDSTPHILQALQGKDFTFQNHSKARPFGLGIGTRTEEALERLPADIQQRYYLGKETPEDKVKIEAERKKATSDPLNNWTWLNPVAPVLGRVVEQTAKYVTGNSQSANELGGNVARIATAFSDAGLQMLVQGLFDKITVKPDIPGAPPIPTVPKAPNPAPPNLSYEQLVKLKLGDPSRYVRQAPLGEITQKDLIGALKAKAGEATQSELDQLISESLRKSPPPAQNIPVNPAHAIVPYDSAFAKYQISHVVEAKNPVTVVTEDLAKPLGKRPFRLDPSDVTPTYRTNSDLTKIAVFQDIVPIRDTPITGKELAVLSEKYPYLSRYGRNLDNVDFHPVQFKTSPVDDVIKSTLRDIAIDPQDDLNVLKAYSNMMPSHLRPTSNSGLSILSEYNRNLNALEGTVLDLSTMKTQYGKLERSILAGIDDLDNFPDAGRQTILDNNALAKVKLTPPQDIEQKLMDAIVQRRIRKVQAEQFKLAAENPQEAAAAAAEIAAEEFAANPSIPKGTTFYHGSKSDFDITGVDPVLGAARSELGVGIHLTDDPMLARDYAGAFPARNTPPVDSRTISDTGKIYTVAANVVNPLDANTQLDESLIGLIKQAIDESAFNGTLKGSLKRRLAKNPNYADYLSEVDSTIAKYADGGIFPEEDVLNFQRSLSMKLRDAGYDSIVYQAPIGRKQLVLLGTKTGNGITLQSVTQLPDLNTDILSQATHRYNADHAAVLDFPKSKTVAANATESRNFLQTQVAHSMEKDIAQHEQVAQTVADMTAAAKQRLARTAAEEKAIADSAKRARWSKQNDRLIDTIANTKEEFC